MTTTLPTPLVSTNWLSENHGAVKIIDASWRMPGTGNARDDYDKRHIPGAVFFDIDAVADSSTDLPHMLPSPDTFAAAVGAMGVSESDAIIVYDDAGVFSAPRVWWTFRAMGHDRVAVLNGGLKKWLAEGRPVTNELPSVAPATYTPSFNGDLVRSADDVRDALAGAAPQIIDARSNDRFIGAAPEPRAGLRSGAMPGARNAPFDQLINAGGTLKAPDALRDIFEGAGVDLAAPAITTCGSGVTAAVLALALETLGHRQWSLYDGSWAEWGKEENDRSAFPVVSNGH